MKREMNRYIERGIEKVGWYGWKNRSGDLRELVDEFGTS
jgi:hypothetical protein